MFELTNIVKRPTCVTRTSETLIDQLIINHPQMVTYTGIILFCIASDHDAIYACVNLSTFIREITNFNKTCLKRTFFTLPQSIISFSDDPDEQLETLNALISECLERHATTRFMDEGPNDRGTPQETGCY